MDPAIRASPYEKGLYFVSPEPGTTLQSIGTTEWKVSHISLGCKITAKSTTLYNLYKSNRNLNLLPMLTGWWEVYIAKSLRLRFVFLRMPRSGQHYRRICGVKAHRRCSSQRKSSKTSASWNCHLTAYTPSQLDWLTRLFLKTVSYWDVSND